MYIIKENTFDIKDEYINPIIKPLRKFLSSLINQNGNINLDFLKKIIQKSRQNKVLILDEIKSKSLSPKSLDIKNANKLKPIKIRLVVAEYKNAYYPNNNLLDIVFPTQYLVALQMLVLNKCYNIYDTKGLNFQRSKLWLRLIKDLIKDLDSYEQSIHHEISHWLDDTLHNSFFNKIKIFTSLVNMTDDQRNTYLSRINFDILFFEINAQIHVIKSIEAKYKDRWDEFTIYDVLNKHNGLSAVYKKLYDINKYIALNWLKVLIKRMNRENMLGQNMHTISDDGFSLYQLLSFKEGALIESNTDYDLYDKFPMKVNFENYKDLFNEDNYNLGFLKGIK